MYEQFYQSIWVNGLVLVAVDGMQALCCTFLQYNVFINLQTGMLLYELTIVLVQVVNSMQCLMTP